MKYPSNFPINCAINIQGYIICNTFPSYDEISVGGAEYGSVCQALHGTWFTGIEYSCYIFVSDNYTWKFP